MLAALRRALPSPRELLRPHRAQPAELRPQRLQRPRPAARRSVAGAPVASMHSLAEIAQHHALRVAAVSYAGSLNFGFCADPEIVTDLDGLAAGVEAEAEALTAAA